MFTVFAGAGLARMNPNPVAAVAAAVVAIGAAVLLVLGWRPLLGYAAAATGGIAVLGNGLSSNVGVDDLPALVHRFRSAGADITLTIDGDTGRLPATTGLAVYRILQEALTNAVKHASGSPTAARLSVDADAVELAVDSAAAPGTGTGVGVISMRERAESLGGQCQAGPGGQGWLVQATLPLDGSRRRAEAT